MIGGLAGCPGTGTNEPSQRRGALKEYPSSLSARLSLLPLVSAAAGARPSVHDAPLRPPLPLSGRPKIFIQAGGKMDSRVFVLFIVGISLLGSRILALDHTAVEKTLNENTISLATKGSPQLCQLCEQFATEALFYLKENQTQIEIIDTLHHACLKFHSLKLECTKLVDYYAPLFFTQIASLSPEEFCVSASLCEEVTYIRLPGHEACTLCHEVVDEIRTGLEDPEMELKIIEILLKGCNNTESFVQKCKRLIIQNAPVILEDIKKFLTRRDFCDSIRVCGGKIVHAGGVGPRGLSAA